MRIKNKLSCAELGIRVLHVSATLIKLLCGFTWFRLQAHHKYLKEAQRNSSVRQINLTEKFFWLLHEERCLENRLEKRGL